MSRPGLTALLGACGLLACVAPRPTPASDWRAQQPAPGPAPAFTLPHFEQAKLPNGFTVLVQERRDLPLVSALVLFAAGSAADPAGKPGLADLTYRALLEGSGSRGGLEVAQAFADLGVSPVAAVQPDGALLGVQLLSRNLEPALALLAEATRHPRLATDDFQRRKAERQADLLAREMEPRVEGQNRFGLAVFGPGHPYAHPSDGTSALLPMLQPADARAFYRRWVGPGTSALVLTGDVSLSQATELARRYFGDWKGGAVRPPRPGDPAGPPAGQRRRIFYVPRPGLEQTLVLVGGPAVASGDPDEAPLELILAALGGNFGSRLNLNLREDKAFTYGTSALLDSRRGVGAWTAGAAVNARSTGAALKELMREIEGLRSHPITAEELDRARGSLVGALPGSFETTESTAFALATLFFEERPLDEYPRLVAALEAATPEQLRTAVDRYFNASSLRLVLVGDPELLRTQVTPLGLGALEP